LCQNVNHLQICDQLTGQNQTFSTFINYDPKLLAWVLQHSPF